MPIIPGLPIAYLGLLTLIGIAHPPMGILFYIVWAIVVIVLQVLDQIIPSWMTKRTGGSKYGVWGSVIGLIVGFFFSPIGIIIGPLVGAFCGELLGGKNTHRAIKSAWGSFLGIFFNTVIKVIAVGIMATYFISAL